MYDFSLSMALADFLPVIFFAVSAVLMMRLFYDIMTKYEFALLSSGTMFVFCAGFLKAVWKLLYTLNICDFHSLNTLFLPTQSLGFLFAGLSLIIFMTGRKKAHLAVAAPVVFSGTVLFLVMMVAGLGAMCVCLAILSVRAKKKGTAVLFIVAFIASMGMGYAGRLDSTAAWVNWLEEGINIISQGSLMIGMMQLKKSNT